MATATQNRRETQTNKVPKRDINKVTLEEMKEIPFMTMQRARLIIEYREAFGEFKDLRDVKEVPGIGDGLMKLIDQHFEVKNGLKSD